MTRRPLLPPLRWWEIGAALVLALLVRALHDADVGADDPHAAWFFVVVGLIWNALQTAWQVTSTAISFVLRHTLLTLRWAITNLGKSVALGLSRAAIFTAKVVGLVWRGLRYVFEPLLRVIGRTITSIVGFLQRVFLPVIDFLNRVRGWVMSIYNNWVRPILNAIDIVRQILRVLAQLGFDWARALDAALGRLSAKISFPFTYVIGKLNEAIGWINRIVTLDGLVQRLTLMRSLIRDVKYVNNLWWNSQTLRMTPGDIEAAQTNLMIGLPRDIEDAAQQYLTDRSGPLAPVIEEMVADAVLLGEILRGTRPRPPESAESHV